MRNPEVGRLVRNFAIEVLVYAGLVLAYFLLVLRFLDEPLARLFSTNLVLYAIVALLLIVVQGVVLEAVTSFIMRLLRLDQAE